MIGGPGMWRGLRDPETCQAGEIIDCWRVEAVEPDRRLRLAAETKLPGRAWLEFEVVPRGPRECEVRQTATFEPKGLGGRLYWYALYPVHSVMFGRMLAAIAHAAERTLTTDPPGPRLCSGSPSVRRRPFGSCRRTTMAFHLRHPRFSYRVLTVFALVAIPLAAIGATVVLGVGQSQFRQAFGLQLSQVAEHTAAAVDAYVFRRIIDVSMMGRVPTLRQAAAAGSAVPLDAERVRRLDREWQTAHKVPADLASVMTNEAAVLLRDTTRNDPIYKEILLTDRSGRLVAASNVTTDYYQGDEQWWLDAFNDGEQGRVSVTDVAWDESAKVLAVSISVTVPDPSSERPAGVLQVVADVRELLASVAGLEFGRTGAAQLIRPDGSIVLSRDAAGPDARFFATALLQERLQALKKGPAQFRTSFAANAADGTRHLIGVAPSQLSVSYPNLPWLVAVTQAEDELFAPVRTQVTNLLLVIAIAVASVLVLSLAFSMWLSAPPDDMGMQLVEHPKLHRVAEDDEAA